MNAFAKLTRALGIVLILGSIFYLWKLNQVPATTPLENPTPTPINQLRIISASVSPEDCSIQITTTKEPQRVETGFEPKLSQCQEYMIVLPSPSGSMIAFEDISGGIDSWVRINSIEHQTAIGVEVLGTSSIYSMAFLPDDRLAVLHGYGLAGEQWLRVYDLPKLLAGYPENQAADADRFDDVIVSENTKMLELPESDDSYQYLQLNGDKLQLFGAEGVEGKVLYEFAVSEI